MQASTVVVPGSVDVMVRMQLPSPPSTAHVSLPTKDPTLLATMSASQIVPSGASTQPVPSLMSIQQVISCSSWMKLVSVGGVR